MRVPWLHVLLFFGVAASVRIDADTPDDGIVLVRGGTFPVPGGDLSVDLLSVRGRRVLRGGSYDGAVVNLRTPWRDSHEVMNAVASVGFRCVYPVTQQARFGTTCHSSFPMARCDRLRRNCRRSGGC